MEFLTEKDLQSSENFYRTIQKEWFGNAQTVISVRTGPKSLGRTKKNIKLSIEF